MSNPVTKLEMGVVLRGAFGFVSDNVPHMIRAAFVPFLVSMGATLFFLFSFGPSAGLDPIAAVTDPRFASLGLITNLISAVASLVFACSWHRATLIGLDSPRTGIGFHLGTPELTYLIRLVLIFLITIPVVALVALVAMPLISSMGMMVAVLGMMLLLLMVLYVYARLSLSLPAAAIGHTSFGLASSWRATAPVHMDLLWSHLFFNVIIIVAAFLISFLVSIVTSLLFSSLPFVAAIANLAVQSAVTFVGTACAASFLSWVYGQLGEKPEWVQ